MSAEDPLRTPVPRQDVDRLLSAARAGEPGASSLEGLAASAHLSRFHLSRLLKEHLGFPLRQFLAAARVDRGIEVLLDGHDVTRSQVESGHESASSYTHAFARHTGMAPSRYRQQMRALASHLVRHMNDVTPLVVLNRDYVADEHRQSHGLTIRVTGAQQGSALFVALNPTPIIVGRPTIGIALLGGVEEYEVTSIPDGTYYAMVVELPRGQGLRGFFQMDANRRQLDRTPITFPLAAPQSLVLELRDLLPTDPPITPNIPKLFLDGVRGRGGAQVSNPGQGDSNSGQSNTGEPG